MKLVEYKWPPREEMYRLLPASFYHDTRTTEEAASDAECHYSSWYKLLLGLSTGNASANGALGLSNAARS